MSPVGLLPWLRAHLLHSSDANARSHARKMKEADTLLDEQARRRAEYARRVAAAERKYRGYTRP